MRGFKRSPETTRLVEALRALKPGESLTLGALSAIVGFDVDAEQGKLYHARDILLREQHAKIDLRNGQVFRVEDRGVVSGTTRTYRKRASMAAFRGANALYSVDYQALPEGEQKAHNVGLAMFGAVRASLSAQAAKRLEKTTEGPKFLPSDAVESLKK